MKIRCRRLIFGPEPNSQEPHSRMLKDSLSWRFLVLKSLVKGWSHKRGAISHLEILKEWFSKILDILKMIVPIPLNTKSVLK